MPEREPTRSRASGTPIEIATPARPRRPRRAAAPIESVEPTDLPVAVNARTIWRGDMAGWLDALCAAVRPLEINSAPLDALNACEGLAGGLAERVVHARGNSPFTDWSDLMRRVRGIGARLARRLSESGATVNGLPYAGAPTRPSSLS